MPPCTRRQWLAAASVSALGSLSPLRLLCAAPEPQALSSRKKTGLDLSDFEPRSMLHVSSHPVERARFPVIDIHTHLAFSARSEKGVAMGEERKFLATPEELLEVMERKNIRTMVNLTGGTGAGLGKSLQRFDQAHPGRFLTFTEPMWSRTHQPDYPKLQAVEIERAKKAGARGLKILKTLGLYLRQDLTTGPLVKVDDPRFDPMWEACGQLNLPVAIHVSDPEAFFLDTDRFNERFEELANHPAWSFHGRDFPSNRELLEARNRVFTRHTKTQFIALHVGNNAENLASVSECLERFPNMQVEIGARIGELGRQPRTARKFFDRFQDRILFGTDAVPNGVETPQQIFGDKLYEIYYRFLETEDEYFDYAPAPVPPQGRWQIYGLGLPEGILQKVYHGNAARLLGVQV
ncbi:MAG: amidohydrolase family protein [Acidobacteria bacterium]|nr:amidohydrolase family protein [Acidobacteriota bacterium]MCI0723792.1 amidohydrolase family protein [Acidobacteriota bacterium]